MQTLYLSHQGCTVNLDHEILRITCGETLVREVQLPHLDLILVFGRSQLTTDVIRTCMQRNIPIAYLSRMGRCYGRVIPFQTSYRYLARRQAELPETRSLEAARALVSAKLRNSRVLLMRHHRRRPHATLEQTIQILEHLADQSERTRCQAQLVGLEGAGAFNYFNALGECLLNPEFVLAGRSKRPPGNPVNALLSFGYHVLWNHLLALVELQGLDPYLGCLHASDPGHAALVSDLIEPFRAPIVDALVLNLINNRQMLADEHFTYRRGGCYLNEAGRTRFLTAFHEHLGESGQGNDPGSPRWDLLLKQVRAYRSFVNRPDYTYTPYRIR